MSTLLKQVLKPQQEIAVTNPLTDMKCQVEGMEIAHDLSIESMKMTALFDKLSHVSQIPTMENHSNVSLESLNVTSGGLGDLSTENRVVNAIKRIWEAIKQAWDKVKRRMRDFFQWIRNFFRGSKAKEVEQKIEGYSENRDDIINNPNIDAGTLVQINEVINERNKEKVSQITQAALGNREKSYQEAIDTFNYIESKWRGAVDRYDDEEVPINTDQSEWTEDYFYEQRVGLTHNFCRERFEHLVEVAEHLEKQGIEHFQKKLEDADPAKDAKYTLILHAVMAGKLEFGSVNNIHSLKSFIDDFLEVDTSDIYSVMSGNIALHRKVSKSNKLLDNVNGLLSDLSNKALKLEFPHPEADEILKNAPENLRIVKEVLQSLEKYSEQYDKMIGTLQREALEDFMTKDNAKLEDFNGDVASTVRQAMPNRIATTLTRWLTSVGRENR